MTCKNDSNEMFDDGLCAECYVQEAWRDVRCFESNAGLGFVVEAELGSTSGVCNWNIIGQDEICQRCAWQSAAEYTRTRKQEIAEIMREDEALADYAEGRRGTRTGNVFYRILARERELLESKRKGMR